MGLTADLEAEIAGAPLGDARLERRARKIIGAIAASPGDSFPDQVEDDAELEALYRFVNNGRVTLDGLLVPHVRRTAERAAAARSVIVIHDTTVFSFGGETTREGLGRIKKGGQGFSAHVALAVDGSDGMPLGVVGVVPTVRDAPLKPRAQTRSKVYDRRREFARWETLLDRCFASLPDTDAVHVMDREGDAYTLLCKLDAAKQSFVIRCRCDRKLDVPASETPSTLYGAIERAPHRLSREVELTTKRPDRLARLRRVRARMTRVASLEAVATRVELRHPSYTAGKRRGRSGLPLHVSVHVVDVREVDPPPGQEAVHWTLYTDLAVDTPEQVGAVIDTYRRRWLIEEFFKALKTGCSFEKRQLESKDALLNALALFLPVAWRLLALRYLSRLAPDTRAHKVLTARQLSILRARGKVALRRFPTVGEAMLAIAAEGGHIKNNGEPGWQVLGRGYEKLLYMEIGFALAAKK